MAHMIVRHLRLVLCQNCKGLFLNYEQFEVHIDKCDGDAFKSSAQLFACERKFFLEAALRSDGSTKGKERTGDPSHPQKPLCGDIDYGDISKSDLSSGLSQQESTPFPLSEKEESGGCTIQKLSDCANIVNAAQTEQLCDTINNDKQQSDINLHIINSDSSVNVTRESPPKPIECKDPNVTGVQTASNSSPSILLAYLHKLQQGSVDEADDTTNKQSGLPSVPRITTVDSKLDNDSNPISSDQQGLLETLFTSSVNQEHANNIPETQGMSDTANVFMLSEQENGLTQLAKRCAVLSKSISYKYSVKSSTKSVNDSVTEKKAKLEQMKQEVLRQCSVINTTQDSKPEKSQYNCNLCNHTSSSVAFMHKHLQSHNGGASFHCDQCDFTCLRRSRMTEHQARHLRPRLLCQHCSATFSDMSSLNRHIFGKHSGNPSLKCTHCDFMATDANSLVEHTRKHTGEMLLCDVEGCSFRTVYKRALRLHQMRHKSEKKYACHLCQFKCIESHVLSRHLRTHQTVKPYQCSSCSYTSTTKYEVVRHLQNKHSQQKRYACDKCSFCTPYAASIIKHIIAHMGRAAAIFACPLCKLRSNSLERAKKHLQKMHARDDLDIMALEEPVKVNPADYLSRDKIVAISMEESRTMDKVMAGSCGSVEAECLSTSPPAGLDSARIDPMKLSFHFHDIPPPPSHSGIGITRSSSIPDLFTFSGITAGHRSNSQSDLLTFSGINITRSNSMSDLVSFASSMCAESSEPVNMDVSLSDATTPSSDVHGLSLGVGDGSEVSLSDSGRPGSPGGVVLAVQCSNCLALLMSEDDIDAHNKSCTGLVQMV